MTSEAQDAAERICDPERSDLMSRLDEWDQAVVRSLVASGFDAGRRAALTARPRPRTAWTSVGNPFLVAFRNYVHGGMLRSWNDVPGYLASWWSYALDPDPELSNRYVSSIVSEVGHDEYAQHGDWDLVHRQMDHALRVVNRFLTGDTSGNCVHCRALVYYSFRDARWVADEGQRVTCTKRAGHKVVNA